MKRFIAFAFISVAEWTSPYALATGDHAAAQTVAQAAPLSEGEVKKVDKTAGKLTIKHGPLDNFSMPAMTMIFRIKDAATLVQVKPGDRITFLAEQSRRRPHRDQARSRHTVMFIFPTQRS